MNFENVLLLSAHPDDAEIGAGGTVRFLSNRGARIDHLVFSRCAKSLPEGITEKQLLDECRAADKILGIHKTTILDFPVRTFNEHRQEILDILWEKRHEKYDLLLCPWPKDTHQDHHQLAEEAVRAWKRALPTILFYEIPANCLGFAPNYFFILSEEEVNSKMDALWQYQSQITRTPGFFSLENFRAVITHTGLLVGERFAEGFIMHSGTVR
ncbi:MAG: PIG-L deacetylase family protein [Candidatus Thorarchaeota archaeon]|jgi:LmbE family N-acetylglucosaminyl deacetylase